MGVCGCCAICAPGEFRENWPNRQLRGRLGSGARRSSSRLILSDECLRSQVGEYRGRAQARECIPEAAAGRIYIRSDFGCAEGDCGEAGFAGRTAAGGRRSGGVSYRPQIALQVRVAVSAVPTGRSRASRFRHASHSADTPYASSLCVRVRRAEGVPTKVARLIFARVSTFARRPGPHLPEPLCGRHRLSSACMGGAGAVLRPMGAAPGDRAGPRVRLL